MIQAFAPRLPRGCSWVMLVIAGMAVSAATSSGQQPAPAAPKADPAAKPAPTAAAAVAPDEAGVGTKVEKFTDPNAKRTLAIFDPIVYRGAPIRVAGERNDLTRLQNMASRVENEDPAFIKRYIEYFAAELSKRDNINALMGQPPNLPPNNPAARGLERAVDALTRPIIDARANNNTTFLTNYTRALFESPLPKLLENNYFARINAMIVLGMAGGTSPVALDFYAGQLRIPDQVFGVKVWAARGYTNAAQLGRKALEFSKAVDGAQALTDFLSSDPKMPFFVQYRVLEALGSIRVASGGRVGQKLDVASVVAGFVADPKARPQTRAYAAWSLGMIRVAPQVAPYNFTLAGNEVGDLAVSLGSKIVAEFDADPANFIRKQDDAAGLTALLMFQVIPAVGGEDGLADSGLLRSNHPDAIAAKPFLTKLDEKIRAVTREAYDLLREAAVNQKAKRNSLEAKLTELKSLLAANQPKDRRLVPGGPLFAGRQ